MTSSEKTFWPYLARLWPLFLIFLLGQLLMRFNGNAMQLGITSTLSLIDGFFFLFFFGVGAWWVFRPLQQCLNRAAEPSKHRRLIETHMADFPWRALKIYLIVGWAYALYLIIVISLVAISSEHIFTWRMFVAITLNFCFGAGVLGPALTVSITIIYSTSLRLKLSEQGWFLNLLNDQHSDKHITSSQHRPWLVFLVTGLLPTLILSLYVWLALVGSQTEEQFILSQAMVLLAMSVMGSTVLVLNITRTLQRVTENLERGLKHLADGRFQGLVPILIDDDMGELARGLNTAMNGLQEREDLKDSLALAAEIQQGLLPGYEPVVPYYTLKGYQQTCYSVGGDYYDYIKLDDERVWVMVADVSGKGYPAALTMANLQAMLRGLGILNWPIEEAANYLNDALCDTLTAGRFVTLFLAKLQPQSHSLVWINAGHVPPLLVSDNQIKRLEASSPPLGLVKGVHYEVCRTVLNPGDTLVAYTDGVTETSNRGGNEFYGEARFRRWLEAHIELPVSELPEALIGELAEFGRDEQDDDLTMLCVRREK